jgi:hypothetical protein
VFSRLIVFLRQRVRMVETISLYGKPQASTSFLVLWETQGALTLSLFGLKGSNTSAWGMRIHERG